jgi:hypothetical protein
MKRFTLFFLALLLFAFPAHALTGRVLVIVCDKLGAASNASAYQANNVFSRCHAVQGWDYETCMASDTSFIGSIYQTNPCVGSADTIAGGVKLGSRYGRYDMIVWLSVPALGWIASDANCATYGMPHFGQMIDRGSAWASPIPMLIPFPDDMDHSGNFAAAYTGVEEVTALTSGKGEAYKDEQGDSLYLFTTTGQGECRVISADTVGYSPHWSHPLMWRSTAARDATTRRYARMWITVGTGNHRVIWLPNATSDLNIGNWLTAFAMFTKVQPIEMPVIAYAFGKVDLTSGEIGADTVQYSAGFKRNVDYAVANGIKLELSCYPYYMQSQAKHINTTQAIAWQAAYPDNIRLTLSSHYAWSTSGVLSTTGTYSQKVARLKMLQDSTGVYFPTISTTRLDIYDGRFIDASLGRADSAVMVLANRGITDAYNWGTADYGVQYPASSIYGVLGAQRTWIGGKELRFHPIGMIARYPLQELNNPDWLKTAYVDTAGTAGTSSSVRRAQTIVKYLNYSIGNYKYIDGAISSNRGTAGLATRVNNHATFQAGAYLPALTFSGGSKLSWTTAVRGDCTTRRAQVDSTRSVFLDTMKQLNAMKRMGDYLVATYGTTGQSPFIWAWLDEVKWDRRNGNQYPNGHVNR